MEQFIHEQNLKLFRARLANPTDTDGPRHEVLLKLLADELAKTQPANGGTESY